MSETENQPKLDPDLVDELDDVLSEEEIIGMYGGSGGKEERMPIVENWFPNADEWQGKTAIQPHQAHALALAKHLPEAFEEISGLEAFIHNIINDYEMLLTSVGGQSREQQMNVLRALFGAGTAEESEMAQSFISTLAAGKMEDKDD